MKIAKVIYIAIVIAVFAVPSLFLLCGFKNENRENRPLAAMPSIVEDGELNTEYAGEFNSFLDSNFAFREYLITAYNSISVSLLNDYSGDNAVIGKNGMLFFGETMDDYIGVNSLRDDQIDSIARYLLDLQTDFSKDGISFVFMTAPNKATIYPEYMPSYLKTTDAPRNIDMLNNALEKYSVNYIDIKSILTVAKNDRMLYYYRDSHWDNYGAMLVYNAISKYTCSQAYNVKDYSTANNYVGDLHYFVYPSLSYSEERVIYSVGSPFKSERPINFDQYKFNETASEANEISVMMYHDSFGRSLQPILSASVGRLRMSSVFPYNFGYVSDDKPTIVIIELVERNLDLLYEVAKANGY